MTTIQAKVPEFLAQQVKNLARQGKISIDQIVSIALAFQISIGLKRNSMGKRAKRGNWKKFNRVLSKVRDVEPLYDTD
ncbi:MAG: hypothetical protein ACOY3I_02275 [Verrucomicrobiota bacterium]